MKTKRALALLLSIITVFTFLTTASISAFASVKVSEANGVVTTEEKDKDGKVRFVFYPKELEANSKAYPVISWANGTAGKHTMYVDLFSELVKAGFVVVCSDDGMAYSGKDQIASLDYIIAKSKDSSSALYNKIATDKIAAVGHSQGGRSVVNACVADARFCCGISIAGSSYPKDYAKLTTPTLFFTGTNDTTVKADEWLIPAFNGTKGPSAYASLIGADHKACSNDPEKYAPYCAAWINAWANNDATALSTFATDGAFSKDTAWQDYSCKNLNPTIKSIKLSSPTVAYTGKTITPAFKVIDSCGRAIPANMYSVSMPKNIKSIGRYKITVKGIGIYSSSATASLIISPKPTALSKLTPTKKGFKATWKKQTSQTTGYEIQIATNSKFTKGVKTYTVSKNSTTSKAISKLSGGKKYYVHIRTYKTVSGTKCASSWSATKAVTTKK